MEVSRPHRRTLTKVLRKVIHDIPDPVPLPSLDMMDALSNETKPKSHRRLRKISTIAPSNRTGVLERGSHVDKDDGESDALLTLPTSVSVYDFSQTLPADYKHCASVQQPSKKDKPENRKSLVPLSRTRSDDQSEAKPLEISGPEMKAFDWKKRREQSLRTTVRRRTRPSSTRIESIPELSYTFEVSFTRLGNQCAISDFAV